MIDVWEILEDRLDYASFVPAPVPDIERADLTRRGGGRYTVLKNPHGDHGAGRYLRLESGDLALYELMDGRRTVQEILVLHLERSGVFALERLARLTSAMRANGFFGEEPPPLYEKLRAMTAKRRLTSGVTGTSHGAGVSFLRTRRCMRRRGVGMTRAPSRT